MAPKNSKTTSVGFSTFTLADKKNSTNTLKVLVDLAIKTKQLTKKDVDTWRQAWQIAINFENPRRTRLLEIYDDVMIDNHLTGAVRNRKIATLKTGFKVIDKKSRKMDEEMTDFLKSRWFKQFMSQTLDSVFYGFSLIEFELLTKADGKPTFKVKPFPREHVIPEYNRIIRDPSDEWKKGFDFTIPPFSNWCIFVGEPTDLGLLLKACPAAISKKNMGAYWDQFGEIFGMPMRIGTTTSRDSKERAKIETMLEDMGAAAWGLFPDGTEIKIQESTRGDAYNVYDKRIERNNSEISKLITGNTMTMDNGSSKSQGEVHERIAEDVCKNDSDMVRDTVNDLLFPFLTLHGFSVDNKQFEWDRNIEYSPAEQLEIDKFIEENFDVDPQYFAEKYNVPITGRREKPVTSFFD